MSAIKLHFEQAERDAIDRFARALNVTAEDVAYAAMNRLMMRCEDPDVARDIIETREWRQHNLPLWSDSACSVHAYEGKQDDEPARSRYV
jgi:hypothetical protein